MGLPIHASLRRLCRFILLIVGACCWLMSYASARDKSPSVSVTQVVDRQEPEFPKAGSYFITSDTLTLEQIIQLAYGKNPTFAEYEANRAIAQAQILQAIAYPNPEIEIGLGMARSMEESKQTGAEYQVGITQPLELPGKRRTRRRAAESDVAVTEAEAEVYQVSLRADVIKAYYRIIYEMESVKLAEQQKQSLDEFQQIVEKRIEAGEAADSDLVKTRIERIKAQRRIQHHRRQQTTAQIALNALCGGSLPENLHVADSLPSTLAAINFQSVYQEALVNHPKLVRLEAEQRQREAIIAREQKAWLPDIKPGISTGRELDKDGIEITLGFEIPLWSRNQGGIAEARAELAKTKAQMNTVQHDIERDLRIALENYEGVREQQSAFEGLKETAAKAVHSETILYQQGETDIWRMLEARQTEQEIQIEYLQMLYDIANALAEVEQAVGQITTDSNTPYLSQKE